MIPLASIIEEYESALHKNYSKKLLPGHLRAISAIKRCRTAQSGELYLQCNECDHTEWRPRSCGHRSCPQCQNHESSEWLMRQ
ncbi:MAG: transposase zinc-binding domain-containing protein [Methyloprofundus sp.]|nr:transposase zinc-binding domain-containing protein [Methyloprofundus sp.]